MKIVVADWETYFDRRDFTLSKMTTEAYIRDPRFEAHGCAIKWTPDSPAVWYDRDSVADVLRCWDWSDTFIIHHHAQFDSLIESHHYGIHPKAIGCTLSMARLLLGNHISVSLDSVRKHFGLPAKITPYNLFDGKHWHELTPAVQKMVGDGACDEVESIWKIFNILAKDFPKEEYRIVDMTTRMFTEPMLDGDINLLADIWEKEASTKAARHAALGISEADLQSSDKFADLLRLEGIEPECKTGKNGDIYAFAKTDAFMERLLEDPSDRVRTLAEARLGAKSTILQTRAETFGHMARRGPMCVYLRYAGAGTLRFSGGDGTNFQNLKRQHPIRKSLVAPKGYLLFPVDASQIECIAEGQRVLTPTGWKPINLITVDDFVWDGLDWVRHEGLIFKGERDVVTIDGLTATANHVIYPKQFPNGITMGAFAQTGYNFTETRWSNAICEEALSRKKLSGIQNVWRAWDTIQFSNGERCSVLDIDKSATPYLQKYRDRSNRQRRTLRSWQSAIINAAHQCQQSLYNFLGACWQREVGYAGFQTNLFTMWLWARSDKNISRTWTDRRTNYRSLEAQSRSPHGVNSTWQKTGTIQKAKVYDLLNCGPRHRFMCEGVLVSNCRVLNYLAGQDDVVDKFRRGEDPYVGLASLAYGEKIYKPAKDDPRREEMEAKRGMGKQGELMCGYGAAWKQFQKTAHNGQYGPPVELSEREAKHFVTTYRNTHSAICAPHHGYWAQAGRMLARLAGGDPVEWGPLLVKDHRIYLPNGCAMIYDTLEFHKPGPDEKVRNEFERDGYWRVRTRQGWKTIWGSKLVQNICEAVSRVIVTQAAIRIMNAGYRILNLPHDELLVAIPDDGNPEAHGKFLIGEMRRPVDWLPGLPLDAEGHASDRYSK